MKGEFYKMDYEAWDEGTDELTLEQEAAYLRLCHQLYRRKASIPSTPAPLGRIWRCHPNKAKKLLADLVAAGKVVERDGAVRPLAARLGRLALPQSVRVEVFARDGFACAYCGDTDGPFEVDHVEARIRGGTDDPSNLCVACRACNRSKGALPLHEWRARQQ